MERLTDQELAVLMDKLAADVHWQKGPIANALREASRRLKERDTLSRDILSLVDHSSKWLNDSTQWDSDPDLGPKWQAIYDRAK